MAIGRSSRWAQFQGALALIARLTRMRTLDVAAAEALVTSLSSVALNQDGRYAGGVASWIQQTLRPAIPRADDIDNALFPALAGAPPAASRSASIDWEGQRYRLDPAVAEEQRLRRVREKQQSASLDQALSLSGHLAEAVGGSARGAGRGGRRRDAERAGGGPRAAGRRLPTAGRTAAALRARSSIERSRISPGSGAGRQRESRPDRRGARRHRRRGAGRRADGVGLRHLDRRPGEPGAADRPRHPPPRFRPRSGRARPAAATGVGGAQGGSHRPRPLAHQGSLLGLDVALSSLALAASTANARSIAPTLSPTSATHSPCRVALLDPFALRDADRDAIVDAVERGRAAWRGWPRTAGDSSDDAAEIQHGWLAAAGAAVDDRATNRIASGRCFR